MTMQHSFSRRAARRHARGVTLIEMMIAMLLGLALIAIMLAVYLNSRSAGTRQAQLSDIQQSVRGAFEFIVADTRGVGHQGCFTGRAGATASVAGLATTLPTDYANGIQGFEYTGTNASLTLSTYNPDDTNSASQWTTNAAGMLQIPVTTIGGANGISPDSDVLVLRGVVGAPLRLSAATATNATNVAIENRTTPVTCPSGTALSGLCANSHALIASCTEAQFFTVASISGTTLTSSTALASAFGTMSEVFPVHTVVYYIKKSATGTGTSLYRRVFDGTDAAGTEQELIEGVENMQLRYGIDGDPSGPDKGNVSAWQTADAVANWANVLAVRVSLLVRSSTAVENLELPTGARMNGVDVTFPTTGPRYDRRVFTTTVALRNRVAYSNN